MISTLSQYTIVYFHPFISSSLSTLIAKYLHPLFALSKSTGVLMCDRYVQRCLTFFFSLSTISTIIHTLKLSHSVYLIELYVVFDYLSVSLSMQ
ncbi:hypothetical protein BY996DRAFT_6715807 [Phakopsora pachyrhizi]|nr:hypothetical protein BY996DRAFT_8352344 [Phakopsora pachyrhizi]KAI8460600.1 hypothetical protein BY996DRAFT_6715807 [Phakopsora pachyrhizi]